MDAEKLDGKILQELQLELRWMPGVDPRNVVVKVLVKAGVATLFGHVSEPSVRRLAETSARRVLGVRSVINEIRLRDPESEAEQDIGHVRVVLEAPSPAWQNPDGRRAIGSPKEAL